MEPDLWGEWGMCVTWLWEIFHCLTGLILFSSSVISKDVATGRGQNMIPYSHNGSATWLTLVSEGDVADMPASTHFSFCAGQHPSPQLTSWTHVCVRIMLSGRRLESSLQCELWRLKTWENKNILHKICWHFEGFSCQILLLYKAVSVSMNKREHWKL